MGMRLLKIFVIFGGLLFMVGSGILVAQIWGKKNRTQTIKIPDSNKLDLHVQMPKNAKLISAQTVGDGLTILLSLPTGGGQVLMFNQDGQLWRRVHIDPTASE